MQYEHFLIKEVSFAKRKSIVAGLFALRFRPPCSQQVEWGFFRPDGSFSTASLADIYIVLLINQKTTNIVGAENFA